MDSQRPWSVTFLGTSSGGGPTATRNCSSLVADVCYDGSLWMVDCAEGTIRQFDFQPKQWGGPRMYPTKVKKLFITHMHADHTMGIIPFLRRILYVPDRQAEEARAQTRPSIEIYGPAGIRQFVRFILRATLTKFLKRYTVHELLEPDDAVTSCESSLLHESELPGCDIIKDQDGFWRGIANGVGCLADVVVDAAPILHRDPCIGYVIREEGSPGRQIVALGDTYDASGIAPIIRSNPCLVIHEATDAFIHPTIKRDERRTEAQVIARTVERGHSTPAQAGAFAKLVGAQALVLNHIGGRFPSPYGPNGYQAAVIAEIERQASEAWGTGCHAVVAYDFLNINIKPVADSEPVGVVWSG